MKQDSKVISLKNLLLICYRLKKQGKVIVFTNGCFDLIHLGHINYLEKAKQLGDILVIGLNSDSSVRKIKGNSRPIILQHDRAKILAALACVDYITVFKEVTPLSLIKAIRPAIIVKGADWKDKYVVGEKEVKSYGGRVVLLPYLKNRSTSKILKYIKNYV